MSSLFLGEFGIGEQLAIMVTMLQCYNVTVLQCCNVAMVTWQFRSSGASQFRVDWVIRVSSTHQPNRLLVTRQMQLKIVTSIFHNLDKYISN